jgi:cytochrome c peroxidase
VADIGLGATDPWGNPLSYTRQLLTNSLFDRFNANLCNAEVVPFPFTGPCDTQHQLQQLATNAASQRVTIDGSFQTPTLRNVGLTPPYFHDGSVKSLEELVDFYNRGGNARGPIGSDTTGSGALGRPLGTGDVVANYRRGSNLDADIENLNLTASEKKQLVAFLKALTDDRVSCDAAPFDHPNLPIPHAGSTLPEFTLPATGAGGLKAIGKTCRPNSGNLFTEYNHLKGFRN